jgi:hypothetical protein
MKPEEAVALAGEFPGHMIVKVMLDDVEQVGVTAVDFTNCTVTRGKRGEPGPNQRAIGKNGFIFDTTIDDFVLETVTGKIEVTWRDDMWAKKWLAFHGIALGEGECLQ